MSLLTRTLLNRLARRTMSGSSAPSTPAPPPTPPSKTDGGETQVAKTKSKNEFVNHNEGVGYKHDPLVKDIFLNPLLSPPPRPPRTPDDFLHPEKLGHWKSFGFDYTSPTADKYKYHEALFFMVSVTIVSVYLWAYGPDYKLDEWARREAFLRLAKREALGLPLIDRNVVDPDRIVLPTEEELKLWPYPVRQ